MSNYNLGAAENDCKHEIACSQTIAASIYNHAIAIEIVLRFDPIQQGTNITHLQQSLAIKTDVEN